MSHERDGVNFMLLTLRSFEDDQLAISVLDLILNGCDFLKFSRCSTPSPHDPDLKNGNLQQLHDLWFAQQEPTSELSVAGERVLCFEGARGRVNLMVTWSGGGFPLNSISGSFPSECLADRATSDSFFFWLEKLAFFIDPVYGHVQNMESKNWAIPFDLKLRLPDVPWGAIFGREYIGMFGEERIRSAPYASIERWKSGHFFCKLTDDLRNPELPQTLRLAVREHLGVDAFMEGARTPRYYRFGESPFGKRDNP